MKHCAYIRDVVQLSDFKSDFPNPCVRFSSPMSQISLTHVYINNVRLHASSFILVLYWHYVSSKNTANYLKSIHFFEKTIIILCQQDRHSISAVFSGGAGGARAPPEFGGSGKGRSLISAFWSLAITTNTPGFKKLNTALSK